MIVTIDNAGRMVIPKVFREALGLRPGEPLQIDVVEGRIVIEHEPVEWEVVVRDGFPVLSSADESRLPKITDDMLRETLEAVRDEGVAGRV